MTVFRQVLQDRVEELDEYLLFLQNLDTVTTQCFGYGNGRFGHPEQNRAISLREAAILQSFPDSYVFAKPDETPRFNVIGRLVGNAVPVRIGEIVGKALRASLQRSK